MKKVIRQQINSAGVRIIASSAAVAVSYYTKTGVMVVGLICFPIITEGLYRIFRNLHWLNGSDKVSDDELRENILGSLCLTGLYYIASREKHLPNSAIKKIIKIMEAEYQREVLRPLVSRAIDDARSSRNMAGDCFMDMRDFSNEINHEEREKLKHIWQEYAYANGVRTPLIEHGYHEIAAALDGY